MLTGLVNADADADADTDADTSRREFWMRVACLFVIALCWSHSHAAEKEDYHTCAHYCECRLVAFVIASPLFQNWTCVLNCWHLT